MAEEPDDGLDRDRAHPNAAALLTDDFWWDCVDETAPFGNDTGADVLEEYRKWRRFHEAMATIGFLPKLLNNLEVSAPRAELTEPDDVRDALEEDDYNIPTHDDAVIALFFSELVVNGRTDPNLLPHARKALERQMLPACLELFSDDSQDERLARLKRMKEVLETLA